MNLKNVLAGAPWTLKKMNSMKLSGKEKKEIIIIFIVLILFLILLHGNDLGQFRNTQCSQCDGQFKRHPLSNFFCRINYRKGRVSAISATARKLAIIIWNMIVKKQPYNNEHGYEFLDQKRKRKVQEMKKLIHKFDIKTNELGLQLNGL
jgi:hypothetical protein